MGRQRNTFCHQWAAFQAGGWDFLPIKYQIFIKSTIMTLWGIVICLPIMVARAKSLAYSLCKNKKVECSWMNNILPCHSTRWLWWLIITKLVYDQKDKHKGEAIANSHRREGLIWYRVWQTPHGWNISANNNFMDHKKLLIIYLNFFNPRHHMWHNNNIVMKFCCSTAIMIM